MGGVGERKREREKIYLVIAGRHDTSSLGASFERSRIKYSDLAWRQTWWQSFEIENPCSSRTSSIHRGYQALGREIESSKYFYIYIFIDIYIELNIDIYRYIYSIKIFKSIVCHI